MERPRMRGYLRLALLGAILMWTLVDFVLKRPRTLRERSRWRCAMCRRILWWLGIGFKVEGNVPKTGMVVCNHLGYLDILLLGAAVEGVFVSKQEVREWPLLGLLTHLAGTIYVKREETRSAALANRAVANVLAEGLPIVVFPEGTSSDGTSVLPFHAPMFEAAVRNGAPVWPAVVSYTCEHPDRVADEICYWGDAVLLPHILGMLTFHDLRGVLRIAQDPVLAENRRQAARLAQEWTAAALGPLRQELGLPSASTASVSESTVTLDQGCDMHLGDSGFGAASLGSRP